MLGGGTTTPSLNIELSGVFKMPHHPITFIPFLIPCLAFSISSGSFSPWLTVQEGGGREIEIELALKKDE